LENLAIGYYRDQDSPNGGKNNYFLHVIKGDPAGGGFSTVVDHSRGFSGINANLDIFVDAGYIVAVMTNYDRAASPVARKIKKLLEHTKQ
jgi:hypothetical protein